MAVRSSTMYKCVLLGRWALILASEGCKDNGAKDHLSASVSSDRVTVRQLGVCTAKAPNYAASQYNDFTCLHGKNDERGKAERRRMRKDMILGRWQEMFHAMYTSYVSG